MGSRMVKRMDEFSLIQLLNQRHAGAHSSSYDQVIQGIGDDAAVVRISEGKMLVAACDAMVEHIHFAANTMDDYHVGYKALASNVSDMAAMGAEPRFALITLMAPKKLDIARLQELYRGIYDCAGEYGVAVIGGDTVGTPDMLSVSITILGEVEQGRALLRSTAKAGDRVFVTGSVGGSAAGLHWVLKHGKTRVQPPYEKMVHMHQMPAAQVKAGRLLLISGHCHALNDISDGLASEAWEIAEASGVRIVLHEGRIPIDEEVRKYAVEVNESPLGWALYGGEDYQLIGTASASMWEHLREGLKKEGLNLYDIGVVKDGAAGVDLTDENGAIQAIEKKGYNHFAG